MIQIMKRRKPAFGEASSGSDLVFDIVTTILMIFVCFIIIYPLYFVVIASLSEPGAVLAGDVFFLPVDPTLSGYEKIFKFDALMPSSGDS